MGNSDRDLIYRLNHTPPCQALNFEAAASLSALVSAAKDVVQAYAEANPLRQASMHETKCGCLRCEVDRLEYAVDLVKRGASHD